MSNFRVGSVFLPTSSPRVSYEAPLTKYIQQNEDDNDESNPTSKQQSARQSNSSGGKRKKPSSSSGKKKKDSNSNTNNNNRGVEHSSNLNQHHDVVSINDVSAINNDAGGDSFFITRGPQIQFPSVMKKQSTSAGGGSGSTATSGGGNSKQSLAVNNVDAALESKKAELERVQQMLDSKRKEHDSNDLKWKDQEFELSKRRNDLDSNQSSMKQFNQINESKIDKYYKKVKEEQNQNEEKLKQISSLQQSIQILTEEKKKKEEELKKIHLFQNYLNIVARHDNNTFEDDMDKILKRYEILHDSIIDLENQRENYKQQIKQTQLEFKTYQKQAQNRLYELNVENQQKRLLLEKLKTKSYTMESAYSQQDLVTRKLSQLYSQVIMSITNLHQRCMETRKFKPTEQPKFITDRLVEMGVPEEYRHLKAIHHRIQDVELIVQSLSNSNSNTTPTTVVNSTTKVKQNTNTNTNTNTGGATASVANNNNNGNVE